LITARRPGWPAHCRGTLCTPRKPRDWGTLSNGALLNAAEEAGFELLLTTDRRIRYQQNLRGRRIALVVLTGTTKWSRVRQHTDRVAVAVAAATAGSYSEVDIPSS